MENVIFSLLLIALAIFPAVLIVIGLRHLRKKDGIICFMVGAGLYTFSVAGAFIPNEAFSFLVSVMALYLCYQFYRWLDRRKSRKYTSFLAGFLSCVEGPRLPSCAPYITPKLTEAVNAAPEKNLSGNIACSVVSFVFDLSYSCLGSTDFRDLFYELNNSGLQMLNICLHCNSYLFEHEIISEQSYKENKEAINEMRNPLIRM